MDGSQSARLIVERTRTVSRSEEPQFKPSNLSSSSGVIRRNSAYTHTSRFKVTPSSSNIVNLDTSGDNPNNEDTIGPQIRKASAPAFTTGCNYTNNNDILQKENSAPVNNNLDDEQAEHPHKGVQFDVGPEVHDVNTTIGSGSGAENTITANLKSWRYMKTLDHPPLLDFYRNSTDETGPSAHRPSMLELLHGEKADEVKNFQKQNEDLVDQHLSHECLSDSKLLEDDLDDKDKKKSKKSKVEDKEFTIPLMESASPVKINPKISTPRKKFGWIEGVFFRCVLNIFGVILYLRVAWVSGQAGIALGQAVVLLASTVTTITALSTCAICTNGEVKGGGAYFLISRSLGPEFGGSIGLIFSVANAVGAAMYVVGFAETVRDMMKEHGVVIIDGEMNDVRVIGLVTCVILMGIIFIGTDFESKMQMGLLVVLLLSILNYFAGTVLQPTEAQQLRGITGFSFYTFKENLLPQFRDGYNFFTVFSIYFPAATGIMAGANISGDLTDPQKAIPLGTLIAIAFTTVIYIFLIFVTGSTVLRDADGIRLPALLETLNSTVAGISSGEGALGSGALRSDAIAASSSSYSLQTPLTYSLLNPSSYGLPNPQPLASYVMPNCVLNSTCPYGLMNYFQVMETGSLWGPLITGGIFAASLSSALASLISAPKVFQAVCKDGLFPYITYFAHGSGKDDEPRRAYFLGFVLAMLIVLVGDLNAIAPIISNFFLCSYALINYACFDNSFAHSPGFRPAFKYYNMWVSLVGAIMCVTVMFIVSWLTALLTFFFFALLFMYLSHRKPDVNWGSSTQAHSYRNALHGMTKLENTDEHVKNYRPQIMVLTGNPAARPSLVDFISNITKDTSLMICGYVVPYNPSDQVFAMLRKLNEQLRYWLRKRHVKSFYISIANTSFRSGVQSLIQSSGLGRLRPNVLAMGFKQDWQQKGKAGLYGIQEYFGIIQDAFDANLGIMILRENSGGLDFSEMMRAHNIGDTNRLKLPDLSTVTIRPNVSDKSLNVTATNALATQVNSSVNSVNTSKLGEQKTDSTNVVANLGLIEESSNAFSSNNSSFRESHVQLDEDYISSQEEYEEEAESEEEDKEKKLNNASSNELKDMEEARKVNFETLGPSDDRRKHVRRKTRKSADNGHLFTLRTSRRLTSAQKDLLFSINKFQRKVKKGVIDVWWLYDDGGLSLLVPYLLTQPKSYLENATLRLFTISTSASGMQLEHRAMVSLLSKFRIQFSDITVIPDVGRKPKKETIQEFNNRIEPFCGDKPPQITEHELVSQRDRTMRQLRISELLREHSQEADLVILSMPIPRKGITSGCLYLTWLDMMTKDLPPTLLVRGNQQSVLTFYS
ncbi:unnamed protein product [Bursaphelenchus okinawaensis]|uniref:Uncharacterized protein n=1 Tax=Bursaphelenchus okinawaensis TaxID=465554 RepID=A0A811L5M1_9BILA|nr:unnamed protein product [Bursaphelenchus okinawaensis]CAG9118212.1 unnamed protein product [Bursaphelenchus okinawaensis]